MEAAKGMPFRLTWQKLLNSSYCQPMPTLWKMQWALYWHFVHHEELLWILNTFVFWTLCILCVLNLDVMNPGRYESWTFQIWTFWIWAFWGFTMSPAPINCLTWSNVCYGNLSSLPSALINCLTWSNVCYGNLSSLPSALINCLTWSNVWYAHLSSLSCLTWSNVWYAH